MILRGFSKLLFFLFLIATTPIAAQTSDREHLLDSVMVVAHSYTSPIKGLGSGTLRWDSRSIQTLPQILGSADPLRYLQYLPAVQTNAEFDAGLHIYGCDNQHNRYSIDGIPVYNPSHLLGLFSTFSSDFFEELILTKSATSSLHPNILGGQVDMMSRNLTDSTCVNLLVGMIFCEANIQQPLGKKSSLNFSARTSYLNWLYGPLLKADDSQIRYGLSDFNLGWTWQPSDRDTIKITAYSGEDKLSLEDVASSQLQWGNSLAGIQWRHGNDKLSLRATVYATDYRNNLFLDEGFFQYDCAAQMTDVGFTGEIAGRHLSFGIDHIKHNFEFGDQQRYAYESGMAANWTYPLSRGLALSTGARLIHYYLSGEQPYQKTVIDPVFNLNYDTEELGRWSFAYSMNHQFLQQTKISQLGLPIEFFFPSSKQQPPQVAHSFSLAYNRLLNQEKWHLCIEVFFKNLSHQKEYTGNALSLISDNVENYLEYLSDGDGRNYGIDFILSKRYGRLSGWCSLTLCRALRSFPIFDYVFPASHERRYDLNILAKYRLSSQLSISGTYILAEGTPFTAPQSFYILNGRIISSFGRYNANRLPPFQRLDLSLSWAIPTRHRWQQSLNFSIYNVCFNKNYSFYRLKILEDKFGYRPLSIMPYPLPSISYSIRY